MGHCSDVAEAAPRSRTAAHAFDDPNEFWVLRERRVDSKIPHPRVPEVYRGVPGPRAGLRSAEVPGLSVWFLKNLLCASLSSLPSVMHRRRLHIPGSRGLCLRHARPRQHAVKRRVKMLQDDFVEEQVHPDPGRRQPILEDETVDQRFQAFGVLRPVLRITIGQMMDSLTSRRSETGWPSASRDGSSGLRRGPACGRSSG